MFSLILAAILLVAGLIYLIVASANNYAKWPFALVALGAVVIVFASCFAQVPTKSVGIPTNFGKTTGETFGPGVHFVAPWTKVTDVDGRRQGRKWHGKECIKVQIADGGMACATISYEWQLNTAQADDAFNNYGKGGDVIEQVYDRIVSPSMITGIVETFGKYDPAGTLPVLSSDMTPEQLANAKIVVSPDYPTLSKSIKDNATAQVKELGDMVNIVQVKVTLLELPSSTQSKINSFNAAVAQTRVTLQERATKQAEAQGNEKLTQSLTPEVLQSKCLDLVADAIEKEYQFNGAFNCMGGGSGVLVGANK